MYANAMLQVSKEIFMCALTWLTLSKQGGMYANVMLQVSKQIWMYALTRLTLSKQGGMYVCKCNA